MQEYKAGDRLIVKRPGNRRMNVEMRNGELWAVPAIRDEIEALPLQDWIDMVTYGVERVGLYACADGRAC